MFDPTLTADPLAPTNLKEDPMIGRAQHFLKVIRDIDYDNISLIRPEEKTQLKHRHKSRKPKGGRPPQDYSVSEMIADLESAVKAKNPRQCLILYLQLCRVFPV